MKDHLGAILITLLLATSSALAFHPMEINGTHWAKMNVSMKQGYLLGFLDALSLEKSERLEHNTADATYAAVVAVIDSFYAEPENTRIPLQWVVGIACNRVKGKFEAFESIEVTALRKHYSQNRDQEAADAAITETAEDRVFTAVLQDDVMAVARFLESGGNVNTKRTDGDQETLLIDACLGGKTNIVELLIKHGADPNIQTKYGRTAIMKTCVGGHTGIAKLLLDHGADVNTRSKLGGAAITSAAHSGNVDLLRLLVSKGADVNTCDLLGQTPLMAAARKGQPERARHWLCDSFLSRGPSPQFRIVMATPQQIWLAESGGPT